MKLGDLILVKTGKLNANKAVTNGQYPFFTCSKENLYIDTYSYDCECVLLAGNCDLNVKYYKGKFDAYQRTYILEKKQSTKMHMPYFYYFMKKYVEVLRQQSIGGVIKFIKLNNITDANINFPSIEKQKEISNDLANIEEELSTNKSIIEGINELIKSQFAKKVA